MVGKKPFVINKSIGRKLDKEDIDKNQKRILEMVNLNDKEK